MSSFTTKKTYISCQFCFEIFFVENTYKFCYEKEICKKLLSIFLQNILYKTPFAKNFVRNTCEFYNFVGNNYPRRNYCQLKFLEKIAGKSLFLQIFLTNLQENSHVIWEFVVVLVFSTSPLSLYIGHDWTWVLYFVLLKYFIYWYNISQIINRFYQFLKYLEDIIC